MIPKASLIWVSAFQNYNICTCQLYPVPLSEMQGTANGGQHQATDRATDPEHVSHPSNNNNNTWDGGTLYLSCIVTLQSQDQDAERGVIIS